MFAVEPKTAKNILKFAGARNKVIRKVKDAQKKETIWHLRNDMRMWHPGKMAVCTNSIIIRKPWEPGKPAQYFVEPV